MDLNLEVGSLGRINALVEKIADKSVAAVVTAYAFIVRAEKKAADEKESA